MAEATNSPRGVVVYLGAGTGDDLTDVVGSQWPKRLVLVDADPENASALKALSVPKGTKVEVLSTAVTGEEPTSDTGRLKVFNLRRFSSLRDADGLRGLYPGLRVVREVDVPVCGAVGLVRGLTLPDAPNHLLVVDVPGEESAVVSALAQAGLLERFSDLDIRVGQSGLYRESGGADDVRSRTESLGFQQVDINDDPERPRLRLHRDAMRVENLRLRAGVEALERELASVTKERDDAATRADEQAKLGEDRQRDLAQARADIEKLKAEHGEVSERLTAAAKERDEAVKRADNQAQLAADRQQELEQARAESEKLKAEHAKITDQVAAVTKERDDAAKRAQDRQEELEVCRREIARLSGAKAADEERMAQMSFDLERLRSLGTGHKHEASRVQEELERVQQQLRFLESLDTDRPH